MPKYICGGGEEEAGLAQASGRRATEGACERLPASAPLLSPTGTSCRLRVAEHLLAQSELEEGDKRDPVVKRGHFSCRTRKRDRKVGMHNLERRPGCLCLGIAPPV